MKIDRKSLFVVAMLALLVAVPARILVKHYSTQSGFLELIYFGTDLKTSRLPEVKLIDPPANSSVGYDGQFYAQIALDPALTRDDLAASLDNAPYRARRIGLPLLAFCLGFGKPAWILQIYALLNFAFWLALLAALCRFTGCRRFRDMLLAVALLWSTGTLTSLTRALTDLPAVVLGTLAVLLAGKWVIASILLGTGALFREVSALSFPVACWKDRNAGQSVKRIIFSAAIMIAPILLWIAYIHSRMTVGAEPGVSNFTFPLSGFVHKVYSAICAFTAGPPQGLAHRYDVLMFELICPLSLAVQAAYMLGKPRFEAEAWRFGIGFALLFFILADVAWAEQYAYCRMLLPLTFAFNLLIHKYEADRKFTLWYVAGNSGMCWLWLVSVFGR